MKQIHNTALEETERAWRRLVWTKRAFMVLSLLACLSVLFLIQSAFHVPRAATPQRAFEAEAITNARPSAPQDFAAGALGASECNAAYPSLCLPRADAGVNVDCANLTARRFVVLRPDPFYLDADRDGIGCEIR